MSHAAPPAPADEGPIALRAAVGGVLMGLANLVPGVSGGTMLLALLLNVAAFTAVFATIARRRTELARAEAELRRQTRRRAPLAEQGISAPAATPITPEAGGRA